MSEVKLIAKKRENVGKGASRKYRAAGMVPIEFYSHHDDNLHLLIGNHELEKLLAKGHGLLNLEVEGQKNSLQCVLKDIQFDPVKGNILHADFQGVKTGEKLTLSVPIILNGTAEGVKSGGILEFIHREVEIECLPKDIPEHLEINVTELEIGDSIRVKDLNFENIRILDDPEETILIIEHSKVAKELEEAEAAAEEEIEEEAQEPEVITARKEEEEEESKE
jgi:large subunit ribosomal protein L25